MQEGQKAPETKDDKLGGPDMARMLVYSDPRRRGVRETFCIPSA